MRGTRNENRNATDMRRNVNVNGYMTKTETSQKCVIKTEVSGTRGNGNVTGTRRNGNGNVTGTRAVI